MSGAFRRFRGSRSNEDRINIDGKGINSRKYVNKFN